LDTRKPTLKEEDASKLTRSFNMAKAKTRRGVLVGENTDNCTDHLKEPVWYRLKKSEFGIRMSGGISLVGRAQLAQSA